MYIFTFFPFVRLLKIGLSTIRKSLNTHLFSNIFIITLNCFCILFWCRIREMYILKVYIYFSCINVQQRATAPFGDTLVISPLQIKHLTTGVYQGSANRCEGYRDSDLNRLTSAILDNIIL